MQIIRKEDNTVHIEFYASIFNSKSKLINEGRKTFREVIREGAWDNTDFSNVLATVAHDKNKILGRTRANTLSLEVDSKGLLAKVEMGETSLHKDTLESIQRGDYDECSFIATVDDYDELYEGGELIRYINSFSICKDVSIVGEGAYAGTDIIIREKLEDGEVARWSELSIKRVQDFKSELHSLIKRALTDNGETTLNICRNGSKSIIIPARTIVK